MILSRNKKSSENINQLSSDSKEIRLLKSPCHIHNGILQLECYRLNIYAFTLLGQWSGRLRKVDHSTENTHFLNENICLNIIKTFFSKSEIPSQEKGYTILFQAVKMAYNSLYKNKTEKKDLSLLLLDENEKMYLKGKKKYLTQGLYAFSTNHINKSNFSDSKLKKIFPLPMYYGISLMEHLRDFKLPWNLFAISNNLYKPSGWRYIRKNIYDKEKFKPLLRPKCNCSPGSGCSDGCLNRELFYECDDTTCALNDPKECTNRAFQRYTEKKQEGKLSSLNTEIVWTEKCGYGLRSLRDFNSGFLIVEYCGEVIEKKELFCRMNDIYKDTQNYYFLNFNAGLILDAGIKGNEARFINHSCQPNCRIEKCWFEGAKPQICHCASSNCRDLGTLIFIESTQEKIQEDVDLQLRYVPSLKKKKGNLRTFNQHLIIDPFDPPEPSLYVQDVGNDYFIVLNKFSIVPRHFLLVTKDFKEQTEGLLLDDIIPIWECLNSIKDEHMMFYNCGPQSGASQLHKHVQFISLKESDMPVLYPDEVCKNIIDVKTPHSHPKIPFIHYIFPIFSYYSPKDLADMFSKLLSLVLKALQTHKIPEVSYNFAMTKRWMFITPRVMESWNYISVNTVGMLGMFLVKSEEELNLVKNTGILKILEQLGISKNT
ncbi:hypothetical protein PCANB_002138 [Pneumocystis canis]|nr:hypothetical protein PCANB_002138 [Pneumocystis canis]